MEKKHVTCNAREDHELVEAALKGNEKAFAILLNKYREHIHRELMKVVNNYDDAEDLTIESFGKAFTNLDSFSQDFAFSTWLTSIARHSGVDFLRRKKQLEVSMCSDDEENSRMMKSSDQNPEQNMIRKQRALMLRKFVRQLKPFYRTIVEYRYFHEYSYEEIAKKLNIPTGSVKAGLFRARSMLFRMIESTGTF